MCKRRHIAVLLFSSFRACCCNDADDAETVIHVITTLVGSPGTLALQFPLVIVVIVVIKQLQLSFS